MKILIPFIILGARPSSTQGPKRDQLVCNLHVVVDGLVVMYHSIFVVVLLYLETPPL